MSDRARDTGGRAGAHEGATHVSVDARPWPSERDALDDLLQRGFRYALALTHDRERAEDLVQDVCLALGRRGGPWETAYLLRSIRNRHFDIGRRAARLRFDPIDHATSDLFSDAGGLETIGLADPELEAALDRLREEEREAIFLSVIEGYSAREIGEMTDRPRGSVLSLIFRARAKLRKELERSGRSHEDRRP